jgi:ATP-binding protein involved in chromosome partitioning
MSGDIFGSGGARKKAEEMSIPFLGEVPGEPGIRQRGDDGRIASVFDDDSPSREALQNVCQNVAMQIAKNLLGGDAPAMPTLEIL